MVLTLQELDHCSLSFHAGLSDNAPMRNVRSVRRTPVKHIPAGKLLKREHFVRILIAGSVKFTAVLKTTLI